MTLGVVPDLPRGAVPPPRLVPHVVVYCVVQSTEYPADVYRRQYNHLQTILVDTNILPLNSKFLPLPLKLTAVKSIVYPPLIVFSTFHSVAMHGIPQVLYVILYNTMKHRFTISRA